MAYIGKQPVVGNFQVCDAISVVNGQAAYTMQVGSANVEPENANHMLVSLNGVLQKPGSSFTISGATITFASNLVTNDVIDFIILLGDTLSVGTPSDDSVGAAQIKNDLISGTTALTAEPADTDEFLVSDAGTLKRIDYSLIKGGGKVLQVVTGTSESSGTTTSTSFSSTGLSAAITPSSSSNKIFVTCSFTASKNSDANDADWAYFTIYRDSTNLGGSNGRGIVGHYNYQADAVDNHFPVNMVILDSPSSTSELTYTVQYAGAATNDTIAFNNREMKTSIILMEISA